MLAVRSHQETIMIPDGARRWVVGLCGLALAVLAAPDAMAFGGGHGGGGHGGFHGGFHHGFGFGCCYGGFYDPYYAYGYPPSYGYPAAPYYGAPPVTYVSPPDAAGDAPPIAYDHSNPPARAPEPNAADCREYQSQVVIGGRRQ